MQASPDPSPTCFAWSREELSALELLRSGRRFLLTGHERPDGDCLGSQAGLASILRSLGKDVWILNPGPPEPQYDYLARAHTFGAFEGGPLPTHDVAVLLDFNDPSRSGALEAPLAAARSKKLVIDHHVFDGKPWWDAAILDTSAAATGLLVHRVGRELGARMDLDCAIGLFTSLVTDTGWFRYPNTDAETLRVAAELVELGVEPAALHRAIAQRKSRRHPPALGRVLAGVQYHADGRLAVATIVHDTDAAITDGDEALDVLRSVGTVEVVLLVRELADGSCKLSARSKTWFDVAELAATHGGGGHTRAAGARLELPLEEAKAVLVRDVLVRLERAATATSSREARR